MNAGDRTANSQPTAAAGGPLPLGIKVEWADIVNAEGEVLAVGQYMGLTPQNALLALDKLISGSEDPARLALTSLARRGAIRNAVGDVNFFPCPGQRHLVLVGMGRQGFFTEPQLVKAVRCMAEAVGRLLRRPRVCAVLIGTGAGNLDVGTAVGGILSGFVTAMQADPGLEFAELRIIERNLDRAYEIVEALKERADDGPFRDRISISDEVIQRPDTGGLIPLPFGYSLMLASIAQACAAGEGDLYATAQALVGKLPPGFTGDVLKALAESGAESNLSRAGLKFRISEKREANNAGSPDRVSFYQDGRQIRTAAMTNLATVTERVLAMKCKWIERIVDNLHAALPPGIEDRSISAYGHLIHQDVREKIVADGPLVIEIDRRLARVPWEMLHDDAPNREPLAVQRPVARQLRTTYSPRVATPPISGGLRALVIGDPDDSLPGAREEAKRVWKLLLKRGDIDADLYLGSPVASDRGRITARPDAEARAARPADLFEIMERLQSGRYDLVHFAGHAAFSEKAPDLSGWVFGVNDMLTPAMLENVDRQPTLIFANACLSASFSPGGRDDKEDADADGSVSAKEAQRRGDALLVASLADEFLRRGVADYIGTAWEVPDEMAVAFAEVFYGTLLDDSDATLGQAVQAARKLLYENRKSFGAWEAVWAAYQHYGDPARTLMSQRSAPV